MSPREVQQYLDAYGYLVKEVLPQVPAGSGIDILESKFSHALEFVKRKNLATLREDPEVRKNVAKLIVENKIKGAEVRQLDKVLKNRRASAALRKTGFKAAKVVLSETDPVATSKVLRDMKKLTSSLASMAQDDLALLKKSSKAQKVLIELNSAVHNVASIAAVKLGGRGG